MNREGDLLGVTGSVTVFQPCQGLFVCSRSHVQAEVSDQEVEISDRMERIRTARDGTDGSAFKALQ
jgi:hypothetical protein